MTHEGWMMFVLWLGGMIFVLWLGGMAYHLRSLNVRGILYFYRQYHRNIVKRDAESDIMVR